MIEKTLQEIALDFIEHRNDKSFTVLYNRLRPGLRNFIMKYHKDPDVIDEILAITLSKSYIFADKYDSQWNFSTWIYKICQNECLMEIRRQNAISSLDTLMDSKYTIKAINDSDWKQVPEYEIFSKEEVVQSHSLYDEILEEIINIPAHYKDIIQDRILEKLTYQEIAEKRNLKLNTVRSRLHSAKKVIKNLWIEKNKGKNNKTINIVGVAVLELLGEDDVSVDEKAKPTGFFDQIEIVKAKYGAGNSWLDVTEKVKAIFYDKGEIKASNKIGGDPCYGSPKALTIEYTAGSETFKSDIKEGKIFKL